MSGGALNYVYWRVKDASDILIRKDRTATERAFGEHLIEVAEALEAVEWELSGDGDRSADEKIRAVLGDSADAKTMEVLLKDAADTISQLNAFIAKH